MRRDDDEQFVVLGGEGITHHGLIEAGNDAEAGMPLIERISLLEISPATTAGSPS